MKFVVLGGYGEMGGVTVRDLFDSCRNCEIIIAGRDKEKAEKYARSFKSERVKGEGVDVTKKAKLVKLIKNSDVAVNCVQYYYNLDVMNACLDAKVNYLDLGGLFHMTKKQLKLHNKFKKKKLIAVLGCGSTPGITNVLAKYGAKLLDRVNEIKVRFAGHDFTNYHMPFVLPYSAYTLFDEFSDRPALFTKGKLIFVKAMSGESKEYFPDPVGEVNSYYTLHSELATFPSSFKKKGIRECSFKVAFDPKFVEEVKFLISTELVSKTPVEIAGKKVIPRDIIVKELNRFIPTNVKIKDLEYVRVQLTGRKGNKETEITLDCLTKSDKKYGFAAGAKDTGVPPSIIAQMIAKGQVRERGVLPPELCINENIFFSELSKRDIKVIEDVKRVIN